MAMAPKVGIDATQTGEDETQPVGTRLLDHLQETLAGDSPPDDAETHRATGPYATPSNSGRIGRFVLLGVLGSGGMGVVHAAYDPKLDRRVALKILHASAGQSSSSLVREAQAMARLSHPNVVTVHDVGEHEGQVFVAMESIEGHTLTQWRSQEQRTVREILEVFTQAGRGLAAAHDKGLVHRDYKPDNVMVGDDGRVRVMDFGLARPTHYARDELQTAEEASSETFEPLSNPVTVDGSLVGTPMYMAPEQWNGAEVDARTDQFSFCVALYQALYDVLPFEGESLNALALSVMTQAPRSQPTTLSVPTHVRDGLQRGLATDPADRFSSMAPLLELLQRDPARARRRLLAISGSVVLAGLVGGALFYRHTRQLAKCEHDARAIDTVWGADNRRTVEAAFADSGVSYATATYERLAPVMDSYAESWASLRLDVCIDGLNAEHRTHAQNVLAAECLDARQQEFGALVTALERGTVAAVRDGIVNAAGLPAVSQCIDEFALRERADRPTDPDKREAVARVDKKIAVARQRMVVADFAGAAQQAAECVQEAEAIGWGSLEARAHLTLADSEFHQGRYPEAESGFRRAFTLALASGQDSLAGEAAERSARVTGVDLARAEEGLAWLETAQAMNTRLGRESGDIHRLRGMLLVDSGNVRQAEREMDRAVALDEAEFGPEHPHTAVSMQARCSVYAELGRYDDALACNERALELQTTVLGPDHPSIGTARNNMGSLYARKGDLPKAHATLQQALGIRERALGKNHPEVGKSLMNLGAVTAMMGDLEAAQQILLRAVGVLEKAVGTEDPAVGRALVNLAYLQMDNGDPLGARASAERALSIIESAQGPDHPDLVNNLSLLAQLEGKQGNFAAAEVLHRRELAIAEQAGADPIPACLARLNLGIVMTSDGRPDEGLEILTPTLATLTERLDADHPHVASAENAVAEALALKGQPALALEHARHALEIRERALGPEHADTLTTRQFVAELSATLRSPTP